MTSKDVAMKESLAGLRTTVALSAVRQSWACGYQEAVDVLRVMAGEFDDRKVRDAIASIANMLERVKP